MFNHMALKPRCGALRPGALQLGGAQTGYRSTPRMLGVLHSWQSFKIYFHMVDVFFFFFARYGPLGNCIARSLTPSYTLEFLLFMRALLRLVVRATFHSR